MNFDHAWIESRIPHKGSMCLLDAVVHWDDAAIVCRAISHRDPINPLRREEGLGPTAGIEYAAQAMAVHGALLDKEAEGARVGYLTSTRDVIWHEQRLDTIVGDLTVRAERESANAGNVLYQFQLLDGERVLLSGRATVMLNAAA